MSVSCSPQSWVVFEFKSSKIEINLLQVFKRLDVEPCRHSEAKVQCDGDNWGSWTDYLGIRTFGGFTLIDWKPWDGPVGLYWGWKPNHDQCRPGRAEISWRQSERTRVTQRKLRKDLLMMWSTRKAMLSILTEKNEFWFKKCIQE